MLGYCNVFATRGVQKYVDVLLKGQWLDRLSLNIFSDIGKKH